MVSRHMPRAVARAQYTLMGMFWFFFEFQFLMEKSNKWNFRLDLVYAEMTCWNTVEIGQGQMGDLPV